MSDTASNKYIKWLLGNKREDDNEDDGLTPWDRQERSKGDSGNPLMQIFGPSKVIEFAHRNMWIGYTNFPITKFIVRKVDKINGVEIFKVEGRHTFVMSPGELFNGELIKKEIERILEAERV